MKISYLTKCPKCGGNIDEDLSRFCPYCGQSLLAEEPEDDIDKEKLYTLEDRTLPFRKIENAVEANGTSYTKIGWSFIIAGIICSFTFGLTPFLVLIMDPYDFAEAIIVVLIAEIFVLALTGWPYIVGIIMFIKAGINKSKVKKIINSPDKVYHGVIRGYSARVTVPKTHEVITTLNIRVEEPTPVLFFMDIADDRTRYRYLIDEKVILFRKDDLFIIRKEAVKK